MHLFLLAFVLLASAGMADDSPFYGLDGDDPLQDAYEPPKLHYVKYDKEWHLDQKNFHSAFVKSYLAMQKYRDMARQDEAGWNHPDTDAEPEKPPGLEMVEDVQAEAQEVVDSEKSDVERTLDMFSGRAYFEQLEEMTEDGKEEEEEEEVKDAVEEKRKRDLSGLEDVDRDHEEDTDVWGEESNSNLEDEDWDLKDSVLSLEISGDKNGDVDPDDEILDFFDEDAELWDADLELDLDYEDWGLIDKMLKLEFLGDEGEPDVDKVDEDEDKEDEGSEMDHGDEDFDSGPDNTDTHNNSPVPEQPGKLRARAIDWTNQSAIAEFLNPPKLFLEEPTQEPTPTPYPRYFVGKGDWGLIAEHDHRAERKEKKGFWPDHLNIQY